MSEATPTTTKQATYKIPGETGEATPVATGALTGAAAGGMTGAIAGPPGALAGAVIGAAVGAVAGAFLHADDKEAAVKDEALDEEIGVIGGDIGAASPNAPKARIGALSGGAAGASTVENTEETPSEGPMPEAGS